MIDDRIARRRASIREQERRRRLRRTITVVVVLVCLVGFVLVERSPLVAIEEVQVAGLQRLDADQIREAAGLELGTSTLRLDVGAASERVEQLALVRTASISRVDPLTVRIQVTEREPVLVVRGDGRSVLVDRDGVVLLEGQVPQLPVIHLESEPPEPGHEVGDDPALANAHATWRGLSGPLRAQVVEYEATGSHELVLHLASGVEVRFGRAERMDEKIRALGAVLADVGSTPIRVVDVRAPRAPTVVGAP